MKTADELYTTLINGIPDGLTVISVQYGRAWTAVKLSNGGFGIAAHFNSADAHVMGDLTGMAAREAAKAILSPNQEEASAGLSVINAWYNSPARLEALDCAMLSDTLCTEGIDLTGMNVGVVGHMKRTADSIIGAKNVYIFELDPRPGDLPASQEPLLLPECDVVVITASALVNHTLPGVTAMASKGQNILLGPSAPMCPALFHHGLSRLSGLVITKPDDFTRWNGETSGSPMPFGTSFLLKK